MRRLCPQPAMAGPSAGYGVALLVRWPPPKGLGARPCSVSVAGVSVFGTHALGSVVCVLCRGARFAHDWSNMCLYVRGIGRRRALSRVCQAESCPNMLAWNISGGSHHGLRPTCSELYPIETSERARTPRCHNRPPGAGRDDQIKIKCPECRRPQTQPGVRPSGVYVEVLSNSPTMTRAPDAAGSIVPDTTHQKVSAYCDLSKTTIHNEA